MKFRLVQSLAATAALMAFAAVPASADEATFTDRRGDLVEGADLHKVTVRNEGRLVIKFKHENLREGYYASVTAYIDTTRRRPGPEYGIGGGIGGDSDWQIFRMRRWEGVGDMPISCPTDLDVNYRKDIAKFTIARSCLADAGRVRISAAATDNDGDRDWAPKFHRFYSWVRRF